MRGLGLAASIGQNALGDDTIGQALGLSATSPSPIVPVDLFPAVPAPVVFAPDGATPLGVLQTEKIGNIETTLLWTKNSDGQYFKQEAIITRNSQGNILSSNNAQYRFDASGNAVSGVVYRFDGSGTLVFSQTLVPIKNGESWNPGVVSAASPVASQAPNLGTSRISANYITDNGSNSHTMTIRTGGTISDIWLLQKNAGNVFTLAEFSKAILASNPGISDINSVAPGQVIYIPQKLADGAITYHYAGGISINTSTTSSAYYMVVPNSSVDGGTTIYERTPDGEDGYTVRQVTTDRVGNITLSTLGYQASADADINYFTAYSKKADGTYSADTIVDGKIVTLSAQQDPTDGFKVTGITAIDSEPLPPGYLRDLLNKSFTEADLTEGFMVDPDGRSVLNQLVAAADPTSTTGGIKALPTKPGVPWYDDENIKDALTEFSSLLGAIKSRNPEAIATAWIGAVSHRTQIPFINQISTSLSVLNGTKRLVDGIERGDLGAVAVSSGGLYTNYLTAELGALQAELAVAANLARTGGAQAIERAASLQSDVNAANAYLKDVGKALAFINLLIAIDKNDLNSAVISAAYFIPGYGPAISLALSIADMILGPLTSGNQTFESEGRFVGHPGGQITIEIGNHNGGANALWNVMAAGILDSAKKAAAADTTLFGQPMGVIAERLPLLILKRGVAVLSYTDALTGKQYSRTFDLQGNYLAPGYIEDIDAASPWGDNPANQFAKNKRDVNPADVQFHRCGASRPSINRVPCRLGGRTATRRQGSGKKFF